MPTHRHHPWERDARADEPRRSGLPAARADEPRRSGPPAAARQWAWALLAIAGVLAIAAGRSGPPRIAPAPTPIATPRAAPVERWGVLAVRSRHLDPRRVLVWGSARSPAKAAIGLRVRVGGIHVAPPPRVPLGADGLFESVVRIPRRLAGRRVDVKVDMYVGEGPPRHKAGVSSQAS